LLALKKSIEILPELKELLISTNEEELTKIGQGIDTMSDIFQLLDDSIDESPPISITEGGLIKAGYNDELDKIRESSSAGKDWLTEVEIMERDKTGIKNMRKIIYI